jgi:putative inorganic carbon (HCO3(-)) transporter
MSTSAVRAPSLVRNPSGSAAGTAKVSAPVSYWLLLAFLLLLYANLPFVLPAAEVFHPARVVAGAALAALAGETLMGRRLQFGWPEGGLLAVFVGAAALSCITALWPGYAAASFLDLVRMALVYFFLANSAATEERLRGVMWIMLAGGLFPAAGTLKNYLTGNLIEGRASWVGIFANPNEVAYSLVILLPLAAYLASAAGWFARLALLGMATVYLAAIFVTFSRGGLVGLAAVVGLYAWRHRNIWVYGMLTLAIAAAVVFAGQHWSRGEDFSRLDGDVSFQERVATSQAGLEMFVDHPLLGVGLGCSVVAWPLYAPQGLYTRGALVTHNTFVQVLSETGVLGAAPFLLLVALSLYHSRKLAVRPTTAALGAAVEGALWGFVVCGLSGGYVLTWFPYILFGLLAAIRRVGETA